MHNKFLNKLGTVAFQIVLLASSLSAVGATQSYYRSRNGGYAESKQYIADTGLQPFSVSNINSNFAGGVDGKLAELSDPFAFHFEKGQKVRELLIVDANVQNKSVFLAQNKSGIDVIELNNTEEGIVQLFAVLAKYHNLDAVHIVSHARSGELQLGGQTLDASLLEQNLSAFSALNSAIKEGGDLLFYGCELAKGQKGNEFLEIIKGNTHVDVAASNDLTGNADNKGNWELEVQKGDITATPLPGSLALENFTGVLQFTGTVTFNSGYFGYTEPNAYDDVTYYVQGLYELSFDGLDAGLQSETISYTQGGSVVITSILDSTQIAAGNAGGYTDEAEPMVLSIVPFPTTVLNANTLPGTSDGLTISIDYSEPMNTGGGFDPVISFPVEDPTGDFAFGTSGWSNGIYTHGLFAQGYDVTDNETTLPNIDVDIDGVQDVNGLDQTVTWGLSHVFTIATGGAIPTVDGAYFFDTDNDGVIDEMVIELSEEVDEGSADINDFALTGGGGSESIDAVSLVGGGLVGNSLDATDADAYVTFEISNITVGTAITGLAVADGLTGDGLVAEITGLRAAVNTNVIEIDKALPKIISALTDDTNGNGQIDRIVVTFSEDIKGTDIDSDDTGDDGITDEFTVVWPAGIALVETDAGGTTDDNVVHIELNESGSADTGATPSLTLNASTINDLATPPNGNGARSGNADDGAAPVVTGVQTADTNGNGQIDRIVVTFSEDISATSVHTTITMGDTDDLDITGYNINTVTVSGSNEVTLDIDESGSSDTDATPNIALAVGEIEDATAGNTNVAASVNATDGAKPIFLSFASVETNNTYVDLTFSEGLYTVGGGPVLVTDFEPYDFVGFSNATIDGLINIDGMTALVGGENEIRFLIATSGDEISGDNFNIRPLDNRPFTAGDLINLFDGNANEASDDLVLNTVTNVTFTALPAPDNSYVVVTFSEAVDRNGDGSGALKFRSYREFFRGTFTSNGSAVSDVIIPSNARMTAPGGGGQITGTEWRFEITSVTGGPTSTGKETLQIGPPDDGGNLGTNANNVEILASDGTGTVSKGSIFDVNLADLTANDFANAVATAYDDNGDGTIDLVTVVFDDAVEDVTVDATKFTFAGQALTFNASTTSTADTGTANDDLITFTITGYTGGTAVTGNLVYDNTIPSLRDDARLTSYQGNGATTGNLFDNTSGATGITVVDEASPVLASIETQDLSGHPLTNGNNGQIDVIRVTFSEDMAGAMGTDFTVTGYTVSGVTTIGSVMDVAINELASYDTDATPSVTITGVANAIEDLAGNDYGGVTQPATDKTGPFAQIEDTDNDADGDGYFDSYPNRESALDVTVTGTVDMTTSLVFVEVNGTGTVGMPSAGNWSVDLSLPDVGTYDIEVTTFDTNGNTGSDATTGEVRVLAASALTITKLTAPTVCIGDDAVLITQSLVFTEQNASNIAEQTNGSMVLQLPDDFFFNTAITPSVIYSAGSGVVVVVSFIGNAILQLEFTANAASTSVLNTIEIENLAIEATGSASGGLVNMTRITGDVDIFGASSDGVAYGEMQSYDTPTAIAHIDITAGTVANNVSEYATRLNTGFTLSVANQTSNTVTWYDPSGSAVYVGETPTDADLTDLSTVTYSPGPTFIIGETVTGMTSGATGIIVTDVANVLELKTVSGTFQNSETIIGDLSTTSTVLSGITVGYLDLSLSGLYTFTVTDQTVICESDPFTFNILTYFDDRTIPVADAVSNSFSNKNFVVTNAIYKFYLSNPGVSSGGHTVSLSSSGAGLSFAFANDTIVASFDPRVAGFGAGIAIHTITYEVTNLSTGQTQSISKDFTVQFNTSVFIDVNPDVDLCVDDAPITYTVDATDLVEINYVYGGSLNGGVLPARPITRYPKQSNAMLASSSYEITIDPADVGSLDGNFSVLIVATTTLVGAGQTQKINVYGKPLVTLPNVNASYCSDAGDFAIQRAAAYVAGFPGSSLLPIFTNDPATDITLGYKLYKLGFSGTAAPAPYAAYGEVADFTSTAPLDKNRFYPSDPDQDGDAFVTADAGDYLIEYFSEDFGTHACSNTAYSIVTIYDQPSMLTLHRTTETDGGSDVGRYGFVNTDEYLLEYCVGDFIESFTIGGTGRMDRSASGVAFMIGETITGATSGATGVVTADNGVAILVSNTFGVFTSGETVTGSQSAVIAGYAETIDITWYDKDQRIIASNTNMVSISSALVGLNVDGSFRLRAEEDIEFYFSTTSDGDCESALRKVTVSVYASTDSPEVSIPSGFTSTNVKLGNIYRFDYCAVNAGVATPDNIVINDPAFVGGGSEIFRVTRGFSRKGSSGIMYSRSTDYTSTTIPITTYKPADGESYIFIITKFENISLTSNFIGCRGLTTIVYIYGWEAPTNPTVADYASGTLDVHLSEGDFLGNIGHTFNGAEEYTWYEQSNQTDLILTLPRGQPMTQAILSTGKVNSNNEFFVSAGVAGVRIPLTNESYTYYVSRTNNLVESRGFDGCESAGTTAVNIIVHAEQTYPSIGSDNSAVAFSDFVDLDDNPDPAVVEYAVCLNQVSSSLTLTATSGYAANDKVMRWYDYTGSSRGSLLYEGANPTFANLQLVGAAAKAIPYSFEVIQITDTLGLPTGTETNSVFDGTESVSAFLDITLSNPEEIEIHANEFASPFARLRFSTGEVYCAEDPDILLKLLVGVSNDEAVNGVFGGTFMGKQTGEDTLTYEVYSSIVSNRSPDYTGNGYVRVDLSAWHASAGGQVIGGGPTAHHIEFQYSDPTTQCVSVTSALIYIDPRPDVTFTMTEATDLTSTTANSIDVCYDDGDVDLEGFFNTSPSSLTSLTGGMFFLANPSSGSLNPVSGVIGNNPDNNTATFDPAAANLGNPFQTSTAHLVGFNYRTDLGCQHTVAKTITVHPRLQAETHGSSNDEILFTEICQGSALEARVVLNGISDYTNYTFQWDLPVDATGVTDADVIPNTITSTAGIYTEAGATNSNQIIFSSNTIDFSIAVTVTFTGGTGCSILIEEDHTQQDLPLLTFNTGLIDDGNTFCANDSGTDVQLAMSTNSGLIEAYNVMSNPDSDIDQLSYVITSSPTDFVDATYVTDDTGTNNDGIGNPLVDLSEWHIRAGGILTGGDPTTHIIAMTYTDIRDNTYQGANISCTITESITITIYPDPDVSFTVTNNGGTIYDVQGNASDFSGDVSTKVDRAANHYCYDEGLVDLVATFGPLTNATVYTIGAGTGAFSTTTGAVSITGNNTAKFDPRAAHNAAHPTSLTPEHEPRSTHTIRFAYEDEFGCNNFIEKAVYVNPLPDPVELTGDQIHFTAICVGSAITAAVNLVDSLNYSDYGFSWDLPLDASSIVQTQNSITYNSTITNPTPNKGFSIGVTVTNTLTGCTFRIDENHVQQDLPLLKFNTRLIDDGNTFCANDSGTDVQLAMSTNSGLISMSNPASDIDQLSYVITSSPVDFVDATYVTDDTGTNNDGIGNPLVDLSEWHIRAGGTLTGGDPTTHIIAMTYTDIRDNTYQGANISCTITESITITIYPDPDVSFTVTNGGTTYDVQSNTSDFFGDVLTKVDASADHYCYDEGLVDLVATFGPLTNALVYTTVYNIGAGTGTFSSTTSTPNGVVSTTGAVSITGNNTAKFDPRAAHNAAYSGSLTPEHEPRSTHTIRFAYEDEFGCNNFIEKAVYVNPLPDPVELTGDQIHFTAICVGSAITAAVNLVDSLNYSDYGFSWDLPLDVSRTSSTVQTQNSITYNSTITNSTPNKGFSIGVTVTNTLTGCTFRIDENHVQQDLPLLTFNTGLIDDGNTFCANDSGTDVQLAMSTNSGLIEAYNVMSNPDSDIDQLSYVITSSPTDFVDATYVTDDTGTNNDGIGNPLVDLSEWHIRAGGILTGGDPTTHIIAMTYTDIRDNTYQGENISCTITESITITIYPDPDVSFTVTNNGGTTYDVQSNASDFFGDVPTTTTVDASADHYCYDEGLVDLVATFGPLTDYSIGAGTGAFSSMTTGAVSITGNNAGLFNPEEAHDEYWNIQLGTSGIKYPYEGRSTHTIRFEYKDEFSCNNFIEKEIYVNPLPEVVEIVGGLEVGDQIRFSEICQGSQLTAFVNLAGVTNYSNHTFTWDLPNAPLTAGANTVYNGVGVVVANSGTVLNPIYVVTGISNANEISFRSRNQDFEITVTITNNLTGCSFEITENHDQQDLPDLIFTAISEGNQYCAEDSDVTLAVSTDSGIIDAVTINTSNNIDDLSHSVVSYRADDLMTPTFTRTPGSGNPTIDMDQWHSDAGGSTTSSPDGDSMGEYPTVHVITMTYTDNNDNVYQNRNTGCTNSSVNTITIYPDPDISFTFRGTSISATSLLGDVPIGVDVQGATDHVCYDEGNMNLAGAFGPLTEMFNLGDATADPFEYTLEFGDGSFSSYVDDGGTPVLTTHSVVAAGNNAGLFNPEEAHDEYWNIQLRTSGIKYPYEGRSTHAIRFTYEDEFSCNNFIEKKIYVNPLPEVVNDAIGGEIQFQALCQGVTLDAFVEVADGNPSAYEFIWELPSGSDETGIVDGGIYDGGTVDIQDDRTILITKTGDNTFSFENDNRIFSITVTVFNASTGCQIEISETETQGLSPEPSFTYVGITANSTAGLDVQFFQDNPSLTSENNTITYLSFELTGGPTSVPIIERFDDGEDAGIIDFSDTNIMGLAVGDYTATITMRTTKGCDITPPSRTITILPVIEVGDPNAGDQYREGFNSGGYGGWYIERASEDGKNDVTRVSSWELFGDHSITNTNTAFTDLLDMTIGAENGGASDGFFVTDYDSTYYSDEISYVYSPAFDIMQFENPAIGFQHWRDFDSQRDGIVVQISDDDGRKWVVLGDNDLTSGVNWFTHQGISAGSGEAGRTPEIGQNSIAVGFADAVRDVDDKAVVEWTESRHAVTIVGHTTNLIRFRFALAASRGVKITEGQVGIIGVADGFAFDDFRIYEKNKRVLVEQFSSSLSADSKSNEYYLQNGTTAVPAVGPFDHILDWIDGTVGIWINYYTDVYNDGTIEDAINARNKVDPATRATLYGVSDAPATRVAGEFIPYEISSNPEDFRNGFDEISLGAPDFLIPDADFSLDITADGDVLAGSVKFISQITSVEEVELAFFFAVVEKRIPAITTAGVMNGLDAPNSQYTANTDTLRHALRVLLPGSAGNYYKGSLAALQEFNFNFEWTISNVYNEDELRVIAFVQYYNDPQKDNSVEQSNFIDISGKSNVVTGLNDFKDVFTVYPNPTEDILKLVLPEAPSTDVYWTIYDQSGREAMKGLIKQGTTVPDPIDTSDLPSGLYIIQLHNEKRMWTPKKVLIAH